MNGRLEKEIRAKKKMDTKLSMLPPVFMEFYYFLDAEGKSYNTLNNYINHNIDFMNYVESHCPDGTFYSNIRATHVNQYMASIRHKNVNGEVKRITSNAHTPHRTRLVSALSAKRQHY